MLLILVSNLTHSQRIRVIGNDTVVTFTVNQAKAITDTFVSQRHTINKYKIQDSLNKENIKVYSDSLQKVINKPVPKVEMTWEGWLFLIVETIIFTTIITL